MLHIVRGGRLSRNVSSWAVLLVAPLMGELAGAQTASPSATPTIPPSFNLGSASCDQELLFSMRSAWASPDEPCHKKLPFGLWVFMKADGTSQDANAKHVLEECLQEDELVLVELITTEDFNSTVVNGAPGEVVGETNRTATYYCRSALDFEAICADDNIIRVSRVDPIESRVGTHSLRSRRLKDTLSEAGAVHKVEELIAGLEELGCARTRGEDQNVCIMSDSFDLFEQASGLQASGDLPASIEIVKELTDFSKEYKDEGSAMMELAFDIASGANFKFNTAFMGEQTFADDIVSLVGNDDCDVIVDDVTYPFSPAFRDGPVAQAVDDASEAGVLYFSSAGNSGTGFAFVAEFECTTELGLPTVGECSEGVAAHVFDESATGAERYLFPISEDRISGDMTFLVQWDDDDFSARAIVCNVVAVDVETGETIYMEGANDSGRATSRCFIPDDTDFSFFLAITQLDSLVEPVTMRLVSLGGSGSFFSQRTVGGSIFGQACASTAISVAAMDWDDATGSDGAFDDPETASVARYSSRGPCLVDGDGSGGDGLETRPHPVTTAATKLQASTAGFDMFMGTSASAPVAAAIATLIRAACSDQKVVTHSDMMEMLTNYEYTIDVTSDADGAVETFGTEAGYGIISAEQMLGWIASNCQEACPGAAVPSPAPVATSAPIQIETPGPTPMETPGPTPKETPGPSPKETPAPTFMETPGPTPMGTPAPTPMVTPGPTAIATLAPIFETPSPIPIETPAPIFETPSPISVETFTPSPTSVIAPPTSVDDWTCSNGIRGVEGYGHCCPVGCGTCGGRNCRKRAKEAGLDAADCCVQRIDESGVYCSDSGTAPCIIDLEEPQSSPCSNGVMGIEGYGHCCALECGRCGGRLCRHRAENAGLEAADCCVQRINESGVYCDESWTAPCIINSE